MNVGIWMFILSNCPIGLKFFKLTSWGWGEWKKFKGKRKNITTKLTMWHKVEMKTLSHPRPPRSGLQFFLTWLYFWYANDALSLKYLALFPKYTHTPDWAHSNWARNQKEINQKSQSVREWNGTERREQYVCTVCSLFCIKKSPIY